MSQETGVQGIPPGCYVPPFPPSRSWIGSTPSGGMPIRSRLRISHNASPFRSKLYDEDHDHLVHGFCEQAMVLECEECKGVIIGV